MFSKTIRSLIAVTLAALLLTACGGSGGSDSSSDGDGAGSVDRGPQGDITGQVIKGVVKNGVVSLYGYANGYIKAEPLATTLTDDQGRYAINYNGDYQGIALLKLSVNKEADQVTRMTCDIKPDCGAGTSFGEDFVLEDGFFLQAAIAEVSTGTKLTVNINALTDLAAAYSLPPNQYPDDVSAVSIRQANQDIAELFGLSGSVLIIPSTDITHADLVAVADNIAVKNALASSAILAVLPDAERGLVEQLRRLRLLYISNDGSFLAESDGAEGVSIFDILNASEALAEELGVKAEIMAEMLQHKNSIDSDGDGLGDLLDAFPHNPNEQYDKDKDGIGANADACDNDPNDFLDSDRDGVCDNADAFPNKYSEQVDTDGDGVGDNSDFALNDPSESKDSDGDGVGDNADAFPFKYSETVDTDGDGVGDNSDSCPLDPNVTNGACDDMDFDGIKNNVDNCPDVPNSDQNDIDSNGTGDACEDGDGDGSYDNVDNCPLIANEDQKNSAGGPAGDVCDNSDGDTWLDFEDNCPNVSNEDQTDSVGTDKGDVCEDSDGDGLKDDFDLYPEDPLLSGYDDDEDGCDNLVDAFPDNPYECEASPFAGTYIITGDIVIMLLKPPPVIVQKTGRVDWTFMGSRIVFDVEDNGSFSAEIPGFGSLSGTIGASGYIQGNYSYTLNGVKKWGKLTAKRR